MLKRGEVIKLLVEAGKETYQGNNVTSGKDWVIWWSDYEHAQSVKLELFNDGSWIYYTWHDKGWGKAIGSCRSLTQLLKIIVSSILVYETRAKRPK